jgi:hypothetical protein
MEVLIVDWLYAACGAGERASRNGLKNAVRASGE